MTDGNNALDRYIELKQEIAKLEKEMDELKSAVFSFVDDQGGSLEGAGFSATAQKRPKYKFSSDYESKNSELKNLRKKEIDEGIATIDGYSEFVSVRLKSD